MFYFYFFLLNETHLFFKGGVFISVICISRFVFFFFLPVSRSFTRFIIDECRGLTQETCDVPPVLSQAMEALQDRPVLYK